MFVSVKSRPNPNRSTGHGPDPHPHPRRVRSGPRTGPLPSTSRRRCRPPLPPRLLRGRRRRLSQGRRHAQGPHAPALRGPAGCVGVGGTSLGGRRCAVEAGRRRFVAVGTTSVEKEVRGIRRGRILFSKNIQFRFS